MLYNKREVKRLSMSINEKRYEFMQDRSPQRDMCTISLVGVFCEMFLKAFCKDTLEELEDYEFNGVRYLEATGYMKSDWYMWDKWMTDNNITGSLTQGFMDSDYDYYLCERFVDGDYVDYFPGGSEENPESIDYRTKIERLIDGVPVLERSSYNDKMSQLFYYRKNKFL